MRLQIGPSSINTQAWDAPVTAMFYQFLAPEGRHPTWKENFIELYDSVYAHLEKYQNARSFFLSHTSQLINQQKQWDVVSKSAADISTSNKYDFFRICLLLTNNETLYNLNIVLSFHPLFEPITALFTITGLWP